MSASFPGCFNTFRCQCKDSLLSVSLPLQMWNACQNTDNTKRKQYPEFVNFPQMQTYNRYFRGAALEAPFAIKYN